MIKFQLHRSENKTKCVSMLLTSGMGSTGVRKQECGVSVWCVIERERKGGRERDREREKRRKQFLSLVLLFQPTTAFLFFCIRYPSLCVFLFLSPLLFLSLSLALSL